MDGHIDRERTTDKVQTDGREVNQTGAGMHDHEAVAMKGQRLTGFYFVGLNSMHSARQAGQLGGALLSLT